MSSSPAFWNAWDTSRVFELLSFSSVASYLGVVGVVVPRVPFPCFEPILVDAEFVGILRARLGCHEDSGIAVLFGKDAIDDFVILLVLQPKHETVVAVVIPADESSVRKAALFRHGAQGGP